VPPFLDEAFRQGLRELGYVEGQNIVIEHRAAEGFVASLARPGGNITGLATISPELVGKQLELLKEVVPKISRVAVLQNPKQPAHPRAVREAEGAARALGVQLQVVEARTPPEIEAAFAAMSAQRAGGVLVLRDAVFRTHRAQITALAANARLPAVYGLREEVEAGGLMAYGASVPQMFRRAATYVDRIVKGARAADLPVEQPATFELVINLKTAKALGVTIPRSLLGRADEVIR
jgi:putative tryptophan/tyrosine transport system substrate-binding protein